MHLIFWLFACSLRVGISPIPSGEALFGWRLVPGQELTYSMTTRLVRDDEEIVRQEHWTYLVRSVDSEGTAHLEGRLTALGVTRVEPGGEGKALDTRPAHKAEENRLANRVVTLQLSANGRLIRLDGLDFHDSLPHRLLALNLPSQPIATGDQWADPAFARPYANLLPAKSVLAVEGFETYKGLHRIEGDIQALIQSRGEVIAASDHGLSNIVLEGQGWWDPDPGVLSKRTLKGSLLQSDQANPGQIEILLELVEDGYSS